MKNQTVRPTTLKNIDALFNNKELGPVALTRKACQVMKHYSRKVVVGACVDHGINPYTARTQYQKWYSQHH